MIHQPSDSIYWTFYVVDTFGTTHQPLKSGYRCTIMGNDAEWCRCYNINILTSLSNTSLCMHSVSFDLTLRTGYSLSSDTFPCSPLPCRIAFINEMGSTGMLPLMSLRVCFPLFLRCNSSFLYLNSRLSSGRMSIISSKKAQKPWHQFVSSGITRSCVLKIRFIELSCHLHCMETQRFMRARAITR